MRKPNKFDKIAITTLWSVLNLAFIPGLIKTKSSLTTVSGKVIFQNFYHTTGRHAVDAATLVIEGYNTSFAIQDKDRAYNYLSKNNVTGHQASILYDPKGHNAQENLTFHVYSLSIDGNEIMTMAESKHFTLMFLLISGSLELLAVWFLFFSKYTKRTAGEESTTNTATT